DDQYQNQESHLALIGDRTGKVYRIGDPVEIGVMDVNLVEKLIDIKVVGMPERAPREKRSRPVEIKANTKTERKGKGGKEERKKNCDKGKDNKKPLYKGAKHAAKKRKGKK